MKINKKYIITISVLSVIVFVETLLIVALLARKPKKIIHPPVATKGKIAIVIDDWGYNLDNLSVLRQIKYPLTLAVLPNLSYSKMLSREARKLGFEIILHLPMEPQELDRLEKDTLMTSMDEEAMKNIIVGDLDSVLYASGVSNHMGSRATEDKRMMEIIFGILKARNLYFLDSFVSGKSVGAGLANKLGLSFARRDIFLDNTGNPAYIKGQLDKLKIKAETYGKAVGIAHARQVTLETLKEVMPQIEKEGYKFVFVSKLTRTR